MQPTLFFQAINSIYGYALKAKGIRIMGIPAHKVLTRKWVLEHIFEMQYKALVVLPAGYEIIGTAAFALLQAGYAVNFEDYSRKGFPLRHY
jgi:hypothetical protein